MTESFHEITPCREVPSRMERSELLARIDNVDEEELKPLNPLPFLIDYSSISTCFSGDEVEPEDHSSDCKGRKIEDSGTFACETDTWVVQVRVPRPKTAVVDVLWSRKGRRQLGSIHFLKLNESANE